MVKKSASQRKSEAIAALGPGGATIEVTEERATDVAWVRDDGAICFGNECVVIKRQSGTNTLDVEIKPNECGEATGAALLEQLISTVGKGGNTRFTVKSEFQENGHVNPKK